MAAIHRDRPDRRRTPYFLMIRPIAKSRYRIRR